MFGLAVSAPFALSGVPDTPSDPGASRTLELALVSRHELLAARPRTGCERLSDRRDEAGRSYVRVDSHPDAGTFIVLRGEGAYRITADARRAELAPPRRASWRWQRALIGQVLPFTAVLRGLEVLHASAVRIGDSAVAIAGDSHSGKSTLATTWLGRGAPFVADDVVTLESVAGTAPLVHPGPPLLSVRDGTRDIVGASAVARLGREVGADAGGARISVERHQTDPLSLGGLVILRRHQHREQLDVNRQEMPDPRLILGATFNFVVRTPQRMTAHLSLAADIAATVPVVLADVGSAHSPDAIADAIERELEVHA